MAPVVLDLQSRDCGIWVQPPGCTTGNRKETLIAIVWSIVNGSGEEPVTSAEVELSGKENNTPNFSGLDGYNSHERLFHLSILDWFPCLPCLPEYVVSGGVRGGGFCCRSMCRAFVAFLCDFDVASPPSLRVGALSGCPPPFRCVFPSHPPVRCARLCQDRQHLTTDGCGFLGHDWQWPHLVGGIRSRSPCAPGGRRTYRGWGSRCAYLGSMICGILPSRPPGGMSATLVLFGFFELRTPRRSSSVCHHQ